MVTLNDKYIPWEGINYTYSEIENCELESRPSQTGFKAVQFWFRKRYGTFNDPQWDTEGNLQRAVIFNNKIYAYTDAWFEYTFDGESMEATDMVPAATVSQLLTDTDFDINNEISLVAQGQEFTATQDSVLRNITVSLRSVGTLSPWSFVRCKITAASNKNVLIATSTTTYTSTQISSIFSDLTFQFNNIYIPNAGQYFVYIEWINFTNAWYVEIEAQTGNPYAWGASFYSDLLWTWTQNGTTDLYFTADMTWHVTYNSNFQEQPIIVSYLWGGRYPTSSTTATVSTYNNTTWEIVVSAPLPWAVWDFIGKYVYVSAWTAAWLRQYQLISDQTSSTDIKVASIFPVDIQTWDTLIFYNSLEQQIFHTQLRNPADQDYLYARTQSWQNNYWYFPTSKQMVYWDNRIVSVKLDGKGLFFSDTQNLEVPTLLTVPFWNQTVYSIAPYGSYLMAYFDNKIGVIRKITLTTTGATAYLYQDLVSTGIFSKNAYLIEWSNMYVLTRDRMLYSVEINTLTINELSANLVNQWTILQNFFNKFNEDGDVSFNEIGGVLRLIYKYNGKTEVYKYLETYEVWVRDTYSYGWNFMNWIYNLNGLLISAKDDKFVIFKGIQDLWTNIIQRIKIYWPVEGLMTTFTLLKVKLRIWFDWLNQIWGRIYASIGGYHLINRVYDLWDIEPIQEINQVMASQWLIWEPMIGQYEIGGEYYSFEQLKKIYPEIFDVGFNVGKKGDFFTLEVINDENKQLYIQVLNPIYNTESDLVIPNKWVIAGK